MTISLYPDEPSITAYWQFTKLPTMPPEVEFYGIWYPMTVDEDTKLGAVLLCGADVTPTPGGHIVIHADVLPRVRADGRIHTGDWVRLRYDYLDAAP